MTTLWIPGPTEIRPELLEEMTLPMIGHRSAEMVTLIERIDPGLRLAFGLPSDSPSRQGVGTHSATAMMEGSLLGAGEHILCIVNGAFSKRWAEIALLLGKTVTVIEVEWGCTVDPAALAEQLTEGCGAGKPYDALTLVVNETSTGACTPLSPIAAALADHPDTLLLVDVVSLIAGAPIDFDANRIDFALAGINKALALPPGLTVFCASERYMRLAGERSRPSFYLDPIRTIQGHEARKTPTTPAIPLYRILARQLEDISSGVTEVDTTLSGAAAWRARFDRHQRMQAITLAWGEEHGIEPLPRAADLSPTVSCLRAGSTDVGALVSGLLECGHQISNGYGPLKGETFRIGHMGDHSEQGLQEMLDLASAVLRES